MSVKLRYYSESFKLCVINRISCGELSIEQARKLYGIGGSMTISRWLKKHNRADLLPQKEYILSLSDVDRLKELELENRRLKSLLGESYIKLDLHEKLFNLCKQDYGIDLKKKTNSSNKSASW